MRLWQQRVLGILALGGGYLGATLVAATLFTPGPWLSKVFTLAFIGLYAWGVWCGLRLLEGDSGAIRANRLYWALQVPIFMSSLMGYRFASGLLFCITYEFGTGIGWSAQIGSQFQYSLLQVQPLLIGVNLFALVVTIFLSYQLRGESSNNSFKPNPLRSFKTTSDSSGGSA